MTRQMDKVRFGEFHSNEILILTMMIDQAIPLERD